MPYDKHIPDEELAKYVRELEDVVESTHTLMMDGWVCWTLITKEAMRDLGKRCQDVLGIDDTVSGVPF